jgi:hypothetical protein
MGELLINGQKSVLLIAASWKLRDKFQLALSQHPEMSQKRNIRAVM